MSMVGVEWIISPYHSHNTGPIKLSKRIRFVLFDHKANVEAVTATAGNSEYHPCQKYTPLQIKITENRYGKKGCFKRCQSFLCRNTTFRTMDSPLATAPANAPRRNWCTAKNTTPAIRRLSIRFRLFDWYETNSRTNAM